MRAYAEDLFEGEGEDADFFINFFSDALIAAMLRWLSNRNCMPPDRFTRLLRRSVLGGAQVLSDSPVGIPGLRALSGSHCFFLQIATAAGAG